MVSVRRLTAAAVLVAGMSVAAPMVAATPALAALPCGWDANPGPTNPWNYPLDGVACVVLDTSGGIRLVAVTDVQPGWTYSVKSAGGAAGSKSDRVEIRFENSSTGAKLGFRYEPGKTVIG